MKTVYTDHGQRLIQGESLNVLRQLQDAGETFDALIADPPYASGGLHLRERTQSTSVKYVQTGTKKRHTSFEGDHRSQLGWLSWCAVWLNACREMLNEGAPVLMFCDWRQLPAAVNALEAGGLIYRGLVVWDKENGRPQPNGFRAQSEFVVVGSRGPRPKRDADSIYLPGVFRHKTPHDRIHQTQKPTGLMVDLLQIVPAGGRVLDPFAGSGTTIAAGLQTGHRVTGIEEHPDIAAAAVERLQNEPEKAAA